MNEHDIERVANTLGTRAAQRVDVELTTAAVLHRLRTDPDTARPWWTRTASLVRVAAVLVMLMAGGLTLRVITNTAPPSEPSVVVSSTLEVLTADELTEVYDSLDLETPIYELVGAGLEDLDEGQLEELLLELEG